MRCDADPSRLYRYTIILFALGSQARTSPSACVCVGVKESTVFQVHFSHLYGKWLEEDSKEGEEEAEKSEITKALVLEPVPG